MTNSKNKSTVDPASRDPFNQPTFLAAKANSREIEKQIRKNLQIDLSLHDEQADAQAAAGKARLAQVEGVSEFLCKRFGLQLTEMRSPN